MEQLPLEMIVHILGYLNLNDLANCRLVCMNFLAATYHVKIGEVVLNKSRLWSTIWFFTNSPKYNEDPINLKSFLIYKTIFNFEHNLKRLHINSFYYPRHHYRCKSDTYLTCEVYDFQGTLQDCSICQFLGPDSLQVVLNGLRQLKQLEFYPKLYEPKIERETKCEIDLPSLEIFVLDGYLDFIIDLNAPQLRVLKISAMDRIHIRHPKSVKRIHTTCNLDRLLFRLNSFENLEFLELKDGESNFVSLFELFRNALISLNFLKELHLVRSYRSSNDFKELKNHLIDIHQERVRRGQELRGFFQGVELVHFDKIDDFEKIYNDDAGYQYGTLRFQLENFDLLEENMRYFKRVNYNVLMKLCKNALPPNYFEKYLITIVCVSGEADLELLVNFLNKLKVLNSVILENVNLDHGTFFERLNSPRLTELLIYGDVKTNFNWEVLLKFKALSSLTIPSAFELNLPFSFFKRLNNFIQISIIKYKEIRYIHIEKRTFFDRFVVKFSVGDISIRQNEYRKVCQNFDEIRDFFDLVERRRNPVHWVKYLGLIYLRYARDFLHFDHDKIDRLCNCNLTWYTDMLVNFIMPEYKTEREFSRRSFYIGLASELELKEQ